MNLDSLIIEADVVEEFIRDIQIVHLLELYLWQIGQEYIERLSIYHKWLSQTTTKQKYQLDFY